MLFSDGNRVRGAVHPVTDRLWSRDGGHVRGDAPGDHPMRLRAPLPRGQTFYERTLEEALAWCLVWLMAPELGVVPLLV
jgi:hypothetical protein